MINIGSEFFISDDFVRKTTISHLDIFRFIIFFARNKKEIMGCSKNLSLEKLFRNSYALSIAYSTFKNKSYFDKREEYRKIIDEQLKKIKKYDCDILSFSRNKKLASPIVLNHKKYVWEKFADVDNEGVVVVEGKIKERADFFVVKDGNEKIPENVVVLAKHLYPNIGRAIEKIDGIICENGSLNSHVAILAREYNVPLTIQKDLTNFKEYSR